MYNPLHHHGVDAKRDLRDLGMGSYAENNCFNLGKLTYGSLISASSKSKKKKGGKKGKKAKANTGNYDEGVMFATYNTLIGKSRSGTRLEQLVECEYCIAVVVVYQNPCQ